MRPDFGKSRRGHFEAQLGDAPGGDQNGRAVVAQPVFDAGFSQFREQRSGVFGGEAGEQRLEIALLVPVRKRGDAADHGDHGDGEPDALRRREFFERAA